jgi:hypothetical protein
MWNVSFGRFTNFHVDLCLSASSLFPESSGMSLL